MKKFVLLLAAVPILTSCYSLFTIRKSEFLSPEELIIQKTFTIIDRTQDELFILSMEWLVRTFVSAEAVIEYQDKDAGIILGKGSISVSYPTYDQYGGMSSIAADTKFWLKIETKEAEIRVTVSDAFFEGPSQFNSPFGRGVVALETHVDTRELMDCFQPEIVDLMNSLALYMLRSDCDW